MELDASSASHEYDVCLSFAGEERGYVQEVAQELRQRGVRLFYDDYEKATLWGKDLYEHLDWIYRKSAHYCILFASANYAEKVWTSHERKSAQARALQESSEYVLPVKFDDTDIPGLRPTVAYIDARTTSPGELAELICLKLGPRIKRNYVPVDLTGLYTALEVFDEDEEHYVSKIVHSFFRDLLRMTIDERRLIGHIFLVGCKEELPDNVHMSLDLIRRDISIPPVQALEILRGLSPLGFTHKLREPEDAHEEADIVEVGWMDTMLHEDEDVMDYSADNATLVACQMINVGVGDQCIECARNCIEHLDFSNLEIVSN
ncbi:TIR domain-containing protein [Nonomuraea sp. NPDC049725]|uniref:toll/interleukin-1 receptor domain-containing protein n=1 Tax=Nonomuraea sp. NPDC049725 TaxID=3154508 RepID=UPI00342020FB